MSIKKLFVFEFSLQVLVNKMAFIVDDFKFVLMEEF